VRALHANTIETFQPLQKGEVVGTIHSEPGENGIAPGILEALKKIPSRELPRIAAISERATRAIRHGNRKRKHSTLKRLHYSALNTIRGRGLISELLDCCPLG
jgi:hypothetical protein